MNGEFWFYIRKDNCIVEGGEVMVYFFFKGYDVFVCICGVLVRELWFEIIDKYWFNLVEVWYDEGKNDFNLCMFRFELVDVEIWYVDLSLKGMFKMMMGKILNGDEMGEYDKVLL